MAQDQAADHFHPRWRSGSQQFRLQFHELHDKNLSISLEPIVSTDQQRVNNLDKLFKLASFWGRAVQDDVQAVQKEIADDLRNTEVKADVQTARAKAYNRDYIQGKMTKTVAWGLLSSYYDTCPWPDCGLLKADTPWSGWYEVQPSIWATAHTTQFAQPGWKYLDREGCGMLAGGGSYVTLKSPRGSDYSVIIETADAQEPQAVTFELAGGLPTGAVHVWRTNPREQFVQLSDLQPADARFSITLEPNAIYTFSTTTGQQKGAPPIPADTPFPMPYRDDFEASPPVAMPRYFADMGGSFEVAERSDGKGRCMRQVAPLESIRWAGAANPEPETILGSREWRDYTVGVDAFIEKSGAVAVFGRIALIRQERKLPCGYRFQVDQAGNWDLRTDLAALATGRTAFSADAWHRLELSFAGQSIRASIDGVIIVEVKDTTYRNGMVGVLLADVGHVGAVIGRVGHTIVIGIDDIFQHPCVTKILVVVLVPATEKHHLASQGIITHVAPTPA